jgi:BMFP domain-containing protein YqiC
MAKKTPTNLFRNLKSHLDDLSEGSHTASEVASTLNDWARESAETIKVRVNEEVEAAVLRMGFIKRDEFDALVKRVKELEKGSAPAKQAGTKKAATKKTSAAKVKK